MGRLLLALVLATGAISSTAHAQNHSQLQGSGGSGGGGARSLSYEDILGKWCGDSSTYTFDREKLTVRLYSGGQNVLWVLRHESSATWLNILWRPPHVNTVFEFSPDHQTIVQPATRDGKGPRRVFRRCR
jgi:hypothetical protein